MRDLRVPTRRRAMIVISSDHDLGNAATGVERLLATGRGKPLDSFPMRLGKRLTLQVEIGYRGTRHSRR